MMIEKEVIVVISITESLEGLTLVDLAHLIINAIVIRERETAEVRHTSQEKDMIEMREMIETEEEIEIVLLASNNIDLELVSLNSLRRLD